MSDLELEADGPPDEVEVGAMVEAELKRLVEHPRAETKRLKQVAADGEEGVAPYIEIAAVALRVVPVVLLVVAIVLAIYFLR